MSLRLELLVPVLLAGPLLPAASADPVDCNDMAPIVSEMLVDRMQVPEYLALDTAAAAEATFRMNYLHAEQREFHRTVCSAVIRFNSSRFAEAERRATANDPARALHDLAGAATGGLARYADFPDGLKLHYRLELIGNGRTWVVTLSGDPAAGHICALQDRHRYVVDDRLCTPSGHDLQWRRSGLVDAAGVSASDR
ncbi:hypothetical protein KBI52_15150 [Microvirga sp. HBU67558]|uniref:hypothetical protein n=1 Tax=Microvirga TaxID=186650 RepID=UPI001B39ADFD|nr:MULTISPECIES: hypothetical protein [unclassified Microvirga]MBQ0821536.1 hypothetical protein [Microvirga sp. HBU67558]